MQIELIIITFIAAASAGIVAGMLGGGVGLVLVPALLWIFEAQKLPNSILMHMVIGTNVAVIAVTGLVAAYNHHGRQSLIWPIFNRMVVGVLVGTVLGGLLASHLSSTLLILLFGGIVLLLAFYVWFSSDQVKDTVHGNALLYNFFGALFGFIASLIGANPFCVPFLKKMGLDIRRAVGTTIAVGTAMAIGITLTYIYTGWHVAGLPRYSLGYVNGLVFLPLAVAASLFSPLGAKLAHYISKSLLKKLYSLLLLIIGIKMMVAGITAYLH